MKNVSWQFSEAYRYGVTSGWRKDVNQCFQFQVKRVVYNILVVIGEKQWAFLMQEFISFNNELYILLHLCANNLWSAKVTHWIIP